MSNIQPIFIQVIRKPERLCIIKRGRDAEDYFPYCEEVSCDVWGILMSMKSLCGEPVSMWLPEKYKMPNTSTYVQGVEVETDYMGIICNFRMGRWTHETIFNFFENGAVAQPAGYEYVDLFRNNAAD